MPADVETMAYANAAPWHRIGTNVDGSSSPEEMMRAAQLDWTVSKRPIVVPAQQPPPGVTYNPQVHGVLHVPDYFHLVRDSDNKPFGPCGKNFVPVQNEEAFDFFVKFCKAGHMTMETAGSLKGGQLIWVLASVDKDSFRLAGDDEVKNFIMLASPHVWGKALIVKQTSIRIVCANTFAMAMSEKARTFRAPHIRPFSEEVARQAEETLGLSRAIFGSFKVAAEAMSTARIREDVVVKYLADVFEDPCLKEHFPQVAFRKLSPFERMKAFTDRNSPKINFVELNRQAYGAWQSLASAPGADMQSASGTVWGAFNAVTRFCDHVSGKSEENRLYNAWLGTKVAVKARAFENGVALVKAVSS